MDKKKNKHDKIREETNAQLSGFNSFLQKSEFGFTDPDYDYGAYPLNFENIVETLNDVKEIISEALEVYNKLNELLQKEIKNIIKEKEKE
jgi:hypothetical protein